MVARPAGCCNDHVTEVSGLPVTCALNWNPGPSAESVTWAGSIKMETAGADTVPVGFTTITAWAEALRSALVVATTWNTPGSAGAV